MLSKRHYPVILKYAIPGLAMVLLTIVVACFIRYHQFKSSTGPALDKGDVTVIIPQGSSLKDVARLLEEKGVISHAGMFETMGRFRSLDGKIQAGEFLFVRKSRPEAVLETLTRGQPVFHSITIPEGYSIIQIAQLLDDAGMARGKEFIELSQDKEFMAALGVSGPSLEGYLFPATYRFPRLHPVKAIIRAMHKRMQRELTQERLKRAKEINMTELEVLTLASIIEKEAQVPEEMPVISSVFHNRLDQGIKLQSDPTVVYGLTAFSGRIKTVDLKRPTPYNTYVISGLPPGPIANPGASAIEAALHPDDTKYMFFVANGDGSHTFSETLTEHNRAVKRYWQKRMKK